MESADARLKSFTQKTRSWPHPSDTYKATPSTLADAGFFWKPAHSTDDNVICFLCGKSLDGWTDTDDPYDEHFSHSRRCAWAIVKTVLVFEDELPFRWDDEDELPRGERMTKARLETFGKWWPHERTKGWFGTTKRMANAGFFYAPTNDSIDNVQCPYCYLALDGWEAQDDPVNEHQRRQPTCPFFATRVTAPTKSSSAKAAKVRQKGSIEAKETPQQQRSQQGLVLSPRSQHVHSIAMDKQNERKNSLAMRLSKAPTPDSLSFASTEQQSRNSAQSGSSTLPSVMKKASKGEQQLGSPARSVEFDLQGDAAATRPTRKSKGKVAARRDIDQEENNTSQTRRVKIEQAEPIVGATTRSSASTVSEPSSERPLAQTTTTARKRYNLDSPDTRSSTSSEISSDSRKPNTSNVSVVITKRRRLARVESPAEVDAITDNASDGSGEIDIPHFEDAGVSANSTSGLSQPKAPRRRRALNVELFDDEESQQRLQLQGAGEPLQPTKRGGRPRKRLEDDNESEGQPVAKPKRMTTVRAMKQGGRSTPLLKSTVKKAPKALIEIFDLPDEEMENNDNSEPEPKESGNEPEHMQVDAPSAAEDLVQSLDDSAPTNPTADALESANEEIYPTATINDQPRTQEVTATVNIDSSTPGGSGVDVEAMENPMENPTAPVDHPITAVEPVVAPIEHPSTPVRRLGRLSSPELHSTTPVRQQAVSLFDIEYADVVVIDPKTPNRRIASRMDIEGWEDEDRRESERTRLSSPFISPSQWEFDGSLSTSTPKSKRTPVRLVPGITPRLRVKDMVGNGSAFGYAGSPSFKKTRLNLLSSEDNHEELVDRLGELMKEYDSSQVMAAAELALKEEVRLLRRSQNKERKLATASTAPLETPFSPFSEAREGDDLLLPELETSNSNSNSNVLGTPVKNAGVSLMFESTTPGTPMNRTPLPISKVISAIGAASRRNPNAPVSPFVRTPAKKTVGLLRLEDLGSDEDTPLRQTEQDRPKISRDAQASDRLNPFIDSHHSQIIEPGRMAESRLEPAFGPSASQKRRSSSDHLGPKDQAKPSAKPLDSLHSPEEPVESRSRAQPSPEEQDRRRRLMDECGISEQEITMSVEEFHRHCADEQVRLFELQCEAWIQRFLEEAERVRNAIMDDGRR